MVEQKTQKSTSAADRTYREIRDLAMMYKLRPGETLNEGRLAERLQVSRTPLREALNRLASEGFFTFDMHRGFRCRPFEAKEVFDLYELRCELEVFAVTLAVERATDDDISVLEKYCLTEGAKSHSLDMMTQLDIDETFHHRLSVMSGNQEIVRTLDNITARIRFARWVDMEGRLQQTECEHLNIVTAVRARDAQKCQRLVSDHISRRTDQIREVIKEGFARIYLNEHDT